MDRVGRELPLVRLLILISGPLTKLDQSNLNRNSRLTHLRRFCQGPWHSHSGGTLCQTLYKTFYVLHFVATHHSLIKFAEGLPPISTTEALEVNIIDYFRGPPPSITTIVSVAWTQHGHYVCLRCRSPFWEARRSSPFLHGSHP